MTDDKTLFEQLSERREIEDGLRNTVELTVTFTADSEGEFPRVYEFTDDGDSIAVYLLEYGSTYRQQTPQISNGPQHFTPEPDLDDLIKAAADYITEKGLKP